MASRQAVIEWYIEREGRISYSTTERFGPKSYDTGSAIFCALIAGHFLPQETAIGDLQQLLALRDVLLHPIRSRDAQPGDIVICGLTSEGGLTASAYCGIMAYDEILVCREAVNGIAAVRWRPLPSSGIQWYRLREPIQAHWQPTHWFARHRRVIARQT